MTLYSGAHQENNIHEQESLSLDGLPSSGNLMPVCQYTDMSFCPSSYTSLWWLPYLRDREKILFIVCGIRPSIFTNLHQTWKSISRQSGGGGGDLRSLDSFG